ncbi:OsmC family protein [Actinomadura sediminis]|uniref:OsmC family protein n=1 Tax=Actinomadura sediminis TaxID=1038904 RepID=A0ABW3EHK7_9ACTN
MASLAACAAHYARQYLARCHLPADGLEVTAGFTMSAGAPARVSRVELRVRPALRLSDADTGGLLAAVMGCTVHNSIVDPPRIDVRLESEAQAA